MFIQNNFVYLIMSNKQKQLIMETLNPTSSKQTIINSIAFYKEAIKRSEQALIEAETPKEKELAQIMLDGNENCLENKTEKLQKIEKLENMENLIDLLGHAEMVISENGNVRLCIMGDQETQHNNNQVLRALGSSTNELRRMLRESQIEVLDLIHDDGTLHLTISNESRERLGLEITDEL